MDCPACASDKLSVIDSREGENAIRRRRLCLKCHYRFTTYERIETAMIIVAKKNGGREKFCQEKLIRGMQAACKNRPIEQAKLETIADKIEKEINILGEEEVSSHYIGEKVLENLKNLDPVAYLRFASVHKSFSDLRAFEREIQKLEKQSLLI